MEIIYIEIETLKSKPFLLFAWHKQPSEPVNVFNKLEKAISSLDRENKELILLSKQVGAYPIDGNAKYICNVKYLFSFKHLIDEPIRVALRSASIIDHIATTYPKNVFETGV